MSISYVVIIEKYAERHFISKFKKKYKGAWDITLVAIIEELKRIDTLIGVNNIVETIVDSKEVKICKTEFRIAGTPFSRHASGNRCIVAVHKSTGTVNILLVYHKGDLKGPNETAAWKALIKDAYSQYSSLV